MLDKLWLVCWVSCLILVRMFWMWIVIGVLLRVVNCWDGVSESRNGCVSWSQKLRLS